jgi:hypothetical protein
MGAPTTPTIFRVIVENYLLDGQLVTLDTSGEYDPTADEYTNDDFMTQYRHNGDIRAHDLPMTDELRTFLKEEAKRQYHSIDWDELDRERARLEDEEDDYWFDYGYNAAKEGYSL